MGSFSSAEMRLVYSTAVEYTKRKNTPTGQDSFWSFSPTGKFYFKTFYTKSPTLFPWNDILNFNSIVTMFSKSLA